MQISLVKYVQILILHRNGQAILKEFSQRFPWRRRLSLYSNRGTFAEPETFMKTISFVLLILIASSAFAAQPEPFLITSFEPNEPGWVKPQGDAKIVKEHASLGDYAMQISTSKSEYCGATLDIGEPLKKFSDYMFLRIDLFNPQSQPVHFGVRIDDSNSKSFATRFNWESVAAPGASTLEINLTALMLSDSKGNT